MLSSRLVIMSNKQQLASKNEGGMLALSAENCFVDDF